MKMRPKSVIKALFALLFALILAVSIPIMAYAEGAAGETPYTWEYIGTIAGAAAITLLIVQFVKMPLDKVWKIPTRFVVFVIASLLLIGSRAILHGLTWPEVPLLLLNSIIATTTAMGTYELTFAKKDKAGSE